MLKEFPYIQIFSVVILSVMYMPVVAQVSFDEIPGYTEEQQIVFFKNSSPQLQISAENNAESFARMLVDITATQNRASGISLYVLQNIILQWSDNGLGYQRPAYTKLQNSAYLENKLSEIILRPDVADTILAGTITAHSLLYPPGNEILQLFKGVVEEASPRKGKVLKNILRAFVEYHARQNHPIPDYIYKKLPELVNHHSDGVQIESINMLADKNGALYLPELFIQLDSMRHGSGVSQSIIMQILFLDTSKETIERLKLSAERTKNTSVKEYITNSLLPQNLERFQK